MTTFGRHPTRFPLSSSVRSPRDRRGSPCCTPCGRSRADRVSVSPHHSRRRCSPVDEVGLWWSTCREISPPCSGSMSRPGPGSVTGWPAPMVPSLRSTASSSRSAGDSGCSRAGRPRRGRRVVPSSWWQRSDECGARWWSMPGCSRAKAWWSSRSSRSEGPWPPRAVRGWSCGPVTCRSDGQSQRGCRRTA